MKTTIEKQWTTKAGHTAVVNYHEYEDSHIESHPESHPWRCGYVGVSKESPLYGKKHNEQLGCISQKQVQETTLGSKSLLLAFTATCRSDGEGLIRRSLDILIDCHGGLTYSGDCKNKYPIESSLWFFGFDCNHLNDNPDIQTLEYCVEECEKISEQLKVIEDSCKPSSHIPPSSSQPNA
mgnify:CR=1 FL=1